MLSVNAMDPALPAYFRENPQAYAGVWEYLNEKSADDYYKFVFQFDRRHYDERTAMYGIEKSAKVLDAGSGYGQWTMSLARCNDYVIGIDRSGVMIESAARLQKAEKIENAEFRQGDITALDFPDNYFDTVFCWGVFMFLPPVKTLKEFYRVLKPGGRLVAGCVNARGRWMSKLAKSFQNGFDAALFQTSAGALFAAGEKAPHAMSFSKCRKLCRLTDFELRAYGADGSIDVKEKGRSLPMFPAKYGFFDNNVEFIAVKGKRGE